MKAFDFDGNGRPELLVTSPWGLGVVGWNGHELSASTMAQNGRRIGDWLLDTAINSIQLTADMDGDGQGEVLLSSPWGIGLAGFSGGPSTKAMAANGTRVGEWVVDTANNTFLHAADFNHDGRDEVIVTSPWGIGILQASGGGLSTLMLSPNGTRFGEWLLNTADNWFPVAADLDGDGCAELVVHSPWGLGVLQLRGPTLVSISMVPNGTSLGRWRYDSATDRIEAAGDFDGDGRAELLVSGPGGIAILKLVDGVFTTIAQVADGDLAGEWRVDPRRNSLGLVGDVNGDGRTEIIVTSDWGLGVLALADGAIISVLAAPNGTRFDGWNLNTRDNRFPSCLDLDGDGHAEVIVTSPWGLGLLRFGSGAGGALAIAPNGTRFGGWNLDTADNDWTRGSAQSWCLLIQHPDWSGAVAETRDVLQRRGYSVLETDAAAHGRDLLNSLARSARHNDRVFVYLAGHGATGRPIGDYSQASAGSHIIQFGDGGIVQLSELTPAFELMAGKGVDLCVFDGSCDAGETIVAAAGARYVALSTTAVHAPGLTNTPGPGSQLRSFGQPSKFGLWWSSSDVVSRLTGVAPHRFYQKMYRNDDTDIARWSVFYKTAVNFYPAVAGSWDLVTRCCYLFRYIYADLYSDPQPSPEVVAFKASTPVSLDDYLTAIQADFDGFQPSVDPLRAALSDQALLNRAAEVYAQAYPRPWQTTTGVLDWNVVTEPVRTVDGDAVLMPGRWAGGAGFLALAAECRRALDSLASSWTRQKANLVQLDAKLRADLIFRKVADINTLRPVLGVAEQLRRSQFEQARRVERLDLVTALREGLPLPLPTLAVAQGAGDPPLDGPIQRVGQVGDPRLERVVPLAHQVRAQEERADPAAALTALRAERLMGGDIEPLDLAVPVSKRLIEAVRTWVLDRSSAEIIADIRAIQVADFLLLDHLHYYLTIVEEAISRVQEPGVQPGDLVAF